MVRKGNEYSVLGDGSGHEDGDGGYWKMARGRRRGHHELGDGVKTEMEEMHDESGMRTDSNVIKLGKALRDRIYYTRINSVHSERPLGWLSRHNQSVHFCSRALHFNGATCLLHHRSEVCMFPGCVV